MATPVEPEVPADNIYVVWGMVCSDMTLQYPFRDYKEQKSKKEKSGHCTLGGSWTPVGLRRQQQHRVAVSRSLSNSFEAQHLLSTMKAVVASVFDFLSS